MKEKKCYEATRALHEEVLDALYCEQLNVQVAHTKAIWTNSTKNKRICEGVVDQYSNDANTTNEI